LIVCFSLEIRDDATSWSFTLVTLSPAGKAAEAGRAISATGLSAAAATAPTANRRCNPFDTMPVPPDLGRCPRRPTSNVTCQPPGRVGIVTGSVGNVMGNVGSVTGSVGSVVGRVGSVTGRVGNVTGSVGKVIGKVGNVTGSDGRVGPPPPDPAFIGVAVAAKEFPEPDINVLSSEVTRPHAEKVGIGNDPAIVVAPFKFATPCITIVNGALVHVEPTRSPDGNVTGGSVTGGSVVGSDGKVTGNVGSVGSDASGRFGNDGAANALTMWMTHVDVAVIFFVFRLIFPMTGFFWMNCAVAVIGASPASFSVKVVAGSFIVPWNWPVFMSIAPLNAPAAGLIVCFSFGIRDDATSLSFRLWTLSPAGNAADAGRAARATGLSAASATVPTANRRCIPFESMSVPPDRGAAAPPL